MAIKIDTSKIENELRRRINVALQTEAVKVIKETEKKHIQSDVYGSYTPLYYSRRSDSGGLADENNMVVHTGDLEVSVSNETPFNNAYDYGRGFIPPPNYGNELAVLVEQGNGGGGHIYNYPYESGPGTFLSPRPFIANTREELRNTNALHDAIVKGLRSNGLEAK